MELSVILPVYNAKEYLFEAIESILNQTFKEFELIIINDGSSDNSLEIIKLFNDSRIVLIDQDNKGLAATLNVGLAIAKGKYIARMDADDIAYPNRFETQLEFLKKHPKVKLLGSAIEIIDKEGQRLCFDGPYTGSKFLKKFLKKLGNPFKHPTVIFDKDTAINLGGYNETIGKYFEDYFLWSRIAELHDIEILKEVLLKYRVTPGSIMSSAKNKEFSDFMIKIVNKSCFSEEDKLEMIRIKKADSKSNSSVEESYEKRIEAIKNNRMNRFFLLIASKFNLNIAMNTIVVLKKARIFKRLQM